MKIGVFDSGIGGKLIAAKIKHELPDHKVVFRADPEYFPYGNKSPQIIQNRLAIFVKKFISLGCQIVVIACNSATTNALDELRQDFPNTIFVGIEPPIKPIARLSKTKKVAILGTQATIKSLRRIYLQERYAQKTEVFNAACIGLAELIEAHPHPNSDTKKILQTYLQKIVDQGVDVVGLACTHYPYLMKQMQTLYPYVTFYDPADAVVAQVKRLVNKYNG